ncbi:MAG: hypothetical protein Q9196_006487 [Gyalolechia fulgens]
MHIRRATALDFPLLASFSVPAFINDELFKYTNPFASKYSEAFRGYFLRRLKQRNAQPGFIVWVAVNDADELPVTEESSTQEDGNHVGAEEICGYAVWCRYGKSEAAKGWQGQTWSEWLEYTLIDVEWQYISFFGLDRSASPGAHRSLQTTGFSTDIFSPLHERWHLHNLCVNPKFQRRGIGGRLISWGLEQAAHEKVPVTLWTSALAEPLYRKMGFVTWARRDVPGIRIGLPSLVHWPRGVQAVENNEAK